jgi:hypothetical protein
MEIEASEDFESEACVVREQSWEPGNLVGQEREIPEAVIYHQLSHLVLLGGTSKYNFRGGQEVVYLAWFPAANHLHRYESSHVVFSLVLQTHELVFRGGDIGSSEELHTAHRVHVRLIVAKTVNESK